MTKMLTPLYMRPEQYFAGLCLEKLTVESDPPDVGQWSALWIIDDAVSREDERSRLDGVPRDKDR